MKLSDCFPKWGPYGKKYMGLSHIASHSLSDGARFDCTAVPAVFGTSIPIPNVTVPSGCHPWRSSADYSFWEYRFDLEWKDRVYADISFSRIDDNAMLIRAEFVNNAELAQNCLLNLFSSMEFPAPTFIRLVLPEKCTYFDALEYTSYNYTQKRPWDEQNPDGRKKGLFYDSRFVGGTGLGDRTDKWHVPQKKYRPFGGKAGDCVTYTVDNTFGYADAVLNIRYRTNDIVYTPGKTVAAHEFPGETDAAFVLNNEMPVVLPVTDEPKIISVPLGKIEPGELQFNITALGTSGAEFDFFCITESRDAGKIAALTEEYAFTPEITTQPEPDGGYTVKLKYKHTADEYYIRTFSENTRFRTVPTGSLEDCPTARLSNSDPTFDDVTESFTSAFARKHSDPGFFQNTIVHTLFIEPGEKKCVYAVISAGKTEYLPETDYEKIYENRSKEAVEIKCNSAGQGYQKSVDILNATLLTNAVYPIYKHGEPIVHHTPGKRWDCLYTWDSGFIGLGMTKLSEKLAYYSLDTYLSDCNNPDYAFLHHGSPVPVQIYLYLELLNSANDKTGLLKLYPRVKLYYDFMAGKVRGSTTARFKSGLTTTYDYFYSSSGMDDYPPQVAMIKEEKRGIAAPVISTSQCIRFAKILGMTADKLGKTDDSAVYKKDVERFTEALNKYSWDCDSGYYGYVLHDENDEPTGIYRTSDGENRNKGLDGIYPFIAGACDAVQKEKILNHLKNPKEMFSPYGISAVDMTASYFMVNGYWNGNVWFPHQWFIWKALLDCAESDFAYKVAKAALDTWEREVGATYYTFEMVNVVTGRGGWFHNFGGLSSPLCLWECAYYKPGNFETGFDVFVEKSVFSDDNRRFSAEFTDYGTDGEYTVIAVMNEERSDYTVVVDGEKTPYNIRVPGTIEITVKARYKANRSIQIY